MSSKDSASPWLFIDTTQTHRFRIGLVGLQDTHVYAVSKRSHALLHEIERRIGRQGLRRIAGVCVVHGPGSFSAVRSGVLSANLLARLYRKPLIGLSADEAADLDRVAREVSAGSIRSVPYVQPTYVSEPNITSPAVSSL